MARQYTLPLPKSSDADAPWTTVTIDLPVELAERLTAVYREADGRPVRLDTAVLAAVYCALHAHAPTHTDGGGTL